MRQEYNKLFDKITSERSDKELLEGALRKAENMKQKKKFNKKAVIIPVAAAMTLAVGGIGVGAAFGFEHLTNMFGGNQTLVSEIQSNVFEDSDGHVKVTIEQLLSDGRYVHAAVHYEALDERGISWLASEPFGTELNSSHSILHIKCGDENIGGSVSAYGSIESKELRTETDRYFYLVTDVYDDIWDNNKLLGYMRYPMTDGTHKSDIEIESTMEVKRFNVVGDERCSKYLTPTYIEISPLSYALYAHDDYGLVAVEYPETGGVKMYTTIPFDEYKTEILDKDKYLVLGDGERILLANGGGGSRENGEHLWDSAEIFDATAYYNCIEKEYTVELDFNEIVGLEIDGVYYNLIAE